MKNWGEKQWMIATIAGFAVVLLGLAGACFYEWSSVLAPKQKTREERKAALAAEKQNELQIPKLEVEKKDLEKKQSEFKEKLPTASEVQLEAFRKTLTNYATQSNVIITGIRPVAATSVGPGAAGAQAKPFDEISFNLDVKGTFATLGNFVYLVETHRRLIKVESLDLKPEGTGTSVGEELPKVIPASLTLKLTTYQFK